MKKSIMQISYLEVTVDEMHKYIFYYKNTDLNQTIWIADDILKGNLVEDSTNLLKYFLEETIDKFKNYRGNINGKKKREKINK